MKWKTVAIIFIIIAVAEGALIVWAYNLAADDLERENSCSYNICNDYDAYYYDSYSEVCYCYIDHEIAYQQFLG